MKKIFWLNFFLLTGLFGFAMNVVAKAPTSIPTPAVKSGVEYTLPFPGILPDHPLYALKLIRDRIWNFLIQDPVKKTEFYLLMADKRLNMGILLIDKKKWDLAETTVSKGEKYFILSVEEMDKVKEEKERTRLREKLFLAAQKHEEVITSFIKYAPENLKSRFESTLSLLSEYKKRVSQ